MSKRSYHQYCGVAKALDVVGERWTLLIVRDLLLGARRYGDLISSLEGITTNLLAKRLREMQEHGLLEHRTLPPPSGAKVYALTELGRALQPAVLALGAFGHRYLQVPRPDDRMSHRWAMVSLMRRSRGADELVVVELEIDDTVYQGRLDENGLEMRDGRPWTADVRLRGPMKGHAQWIAGGRPIGQLVREGVLERDGPARAVRTFDRSIVR